MKIAHICLTGPYSDGWNYQENLLSKYHHKNGHDVCVVASRYTWNLKGTIEECDRDFYTDKNGVEIYRLRIEHNRNLLSKLKKYVGLYELLENLSPDTLFIHGCQFCDIDTIVRYLKKNPNVATYVDNHADFSNSATSWLSKNVLHKIIWRHYAKKIDPFVKKWYGVLPARVDFLKRIYGLPADKIEYLPMGADDELVDKYSSPEIRSEYRKKYGISDDDILLVTGGKIDLAKKQTLLLMDAVNQIDNPKLKLIVFGSVVPELKSDVETRCSAKVKYIGWLSSEESYPHFAMADLVVFPGRHSVFWEQVAGQGIPMIVKYWPGTTHVDRNGNVKFLHNDTVDGIRESLETIFNSDELKKMKSVAQCVKNFFSYRNIAERSIA